MTDITIEHGKALVGVFVGYKRFIAARGHKFSVVNKYLIYHGLCFYQLTSAKLHIKHEINIERYVDPCRIIPV